MLTDRVTLFIKPTEYKRFIVSKARQSRQKKGPGPFLCHCELAWQSHRKDRMYWGVIASLRGNLIEKDVFISLSPSFHFKK